MHCFARQELAERHFCAVDQYSSAVRKLRSTVGDRSEAKRAVTAARAVCGDLRHQLFEHRRNCARCSDRVGALLRSFSARRENTEPPQSAAS
jgi:hypothetical protein